MKKYKLVTVILSLVIISSILYCAIIFRDISDGIQDAEAVYVPLINLLQSPNDYDGKKVKTNGIMEWEFEGYGIFLSKKDYKDHNVENALWIELNRKIKISKFDLKNLNGRVVLIEGTFNKNDKGHMDVYGGSIFDITYISTK